MAARKRRYQFTPIEGEPGGLVDPEDVRLYRGGLVDPIEASIFAGSWFQALIRANDNADHNLVQMCRAYLRSMGYSVEIVHPVPLADIMMVGGKG
jgi:hypothetical protein